MLVYQCECDGLPRQVLEKITEARNLQAVKIRKDDRSLKNFYVHNLKKLSKYFNNQIIIFLNDVLPSTKFPLQNFSSKLEKKFSPKKKIRKEMVLNIDQEIHKNTSGRKLFCIHGVSKDLLMTECIN